MLRVDASAIQGRAGRDTARHRLHRCRARGHETQSAVTRGRAVAAEAGISVREWNARGRQAASGLMCIPGFGGIARTPMAPSTQREVSCSRGTWWRTAAVETSPPSLCPRLRASGHGEAENQREEMSDHSCKPRAKTCNQSARRQQQPKVGSTRLNAVSRHARLQVCRRKFKRLPLPRTHACRGIPEIRAALSPHGLASHCTAQSAFRGASATLLVGSRTRSKGRHQMQGGHGCWFGGHAKF